MPSRASSPVGSPPAGPPTASRSRATSVSTTSARCSRDTEAHRRGRAHAHQHHRHGLAGARDVRPGAGGPRGRRGGGHGSGHRAHRPARRRPHPRPVRRRRRAAAGVDAPGELALRHDGAPGAPRGRRAGRPRVRGDRHRGDHRPGRSGRGPHREHAPLVPRRRAGCGSSRGRRGSATDRRPPLSPRARRGGAGADRVPPGCLPPAFEHGAQDGLQLRLGLGPGPADRRPLAARDRRAVAGGPDRGGTAAGVTLGRPRDGHRRGAPRRGAVRAGLCDRRSSR